MTPLTTTHLSVHALRCCISRECVYTVPMHVFSTIMSRIVKYDPLQITPVQPTAPAYSGGVKAKTPCAAMATWFAERLHLGHSSVQVKGQETSAFFHYNHWHCTLIQLLASRWNFLQNLRTLLVKHDFLWIEKGWGIEASTEIFCYLCIPICCKRIVVIEM